MMTRSKNMSAEGAVGLTIKSGLLGGLFVVVVSAMAVVLGFTVVPLAPGREHMDAARRLAAGLLSSFTLGPLLAFKAIDWFPWMMQPWTVILKGEHVLWQYLATGAPFIALSAIAGFWVVAAFMRYLQRKEGKDIIEAVAEVREDIKRVL